MSFRVPEEKLQEIRERADLVQVVGERVALKKAGVRYVGLCPFHSEKTPSFGVHPGLGIFKCFGCGESGDVISFVMKFEDRPFLDVVRDLAQRFGVQLPDEELSPREAAAARREKEERAAILRCNQLAADHYHGMLLRDAAAREAREYLARRRITLETARRFKLGFAPAAWDVAVQFFRRNKVDLAVVSKAGLIQQNDRGGYYDRFRNRLLFPIVGPANEVLGFGGRQLADGDGAKYLNSPESPVFHKGRCLYGLNVAARAARAAGTLLVVEGYFDLIALVQCGVENVVATLGTALTADHVSLLRRYVREVLVLFDGDEAGVRAAQRSAEILLSGGLSARVVELPRGDDPDSFVLREGVDAFRRRVAAARPVVEFVIESSAARAEPTPAGKARCVDGLKPLLAAVGNEVERALYVAKVSDRLGIPEAAVRAALRGTPAAAIAARHAGAERPGVDGPEVRLVAVLLAHPELAATVAAEPDLFSDGELCALVSRIAAAHARGERAVAARLLADVEDPELRARLESRAVVEEEFERDVDAREGPAAIAARKVADLTRALRERKLRSQAGALQRRLAQAAEQGDEALVALLAAERMELERRIRGLASA